MTAETLQPANRILHRDESVRPAWVPENAVWANGLWYVGNRPVFKPEVQMPPEVRQALLMEEAKIIDEKATEGLPPGYRRFGSLVRRLKAGMWEVAADFPGGPVVEGDMTNRAARIADINAKRAEELQAIANLEAAQKARDEAEAARFRSHNVVMD